jgi:glyoxylase-like metal-dependent hydrolase (beta-lactamase superfamily II)
VHISNVWLYDAGPDGLWLVDTGHRFERSRILAALSRLGLAPGSLAGILLTHRHSDHAGNAAFLASRFGLAVHAHRADAAILRGEVPRPPMPRGTASLASVLNIFEERLPAQCVPTVSLEDGQRIAGLQVFWVPGHTEGSVMFWHPPSSSLLSGDTLLNAIPPTTLFDGLSLPHPAFSTDLAQAHASIVAFHRRGLAYENLLCGHGKPLLGGARQAVEALLHQNYLL